MTKVLVIEQEASARMRLQQELEDREYEVICASSGQGGMRAVRRHHPDLILLDFDLEDMDSLDVLRMLLALDGVPVIVAVPTYNERSAVVALQAGAADCVDKPYRLRMLGARLDAVVRRYGVGRAPSILRLGELTVDTAAHVAYMGDRALQLKPREFKLLHYIACRPGRIISKQEILREVWSNTSGSIRTIDVHLSMLRKQLGESATKPRYLHSIRYLGVRLQVPTTDGASAGVKTRICKCDCSRAVAATA
ncbi:response regulator transcription factor [Streptomyces sp. NPDC057910]|uniref:response regulator transcription factor n=1 Tax=Streptomyces sp. NPDC057910 TaxID=3346278 RepID=UPI0036E0B93A